MHASQLPSFFPFILLLARMRTTGTLFPPAASRGRPSAMAFLRARSMHSGQQALADRVALACRYVPNRPRLRITPAASRLYSGTAACCPCCPCCPL